MKRFSLMLGILVAAMLLVVGAAPADTWSDPAGDAQGGPDVTAVTVTNDAAGVISMSISVPLPTAQALFVVMDTNLNGSWEDPADRAIAIVGVLPPLVLSWVEDWPGNDIAVPSLKASATATTVDLSFAKTEVGIDQGFGFWLGTLANPDQEGWSDEAPNQGVYMYTLTVPPPPPPPAVVKPLIGAPLATPAAPVAGKKFSVVFPVTRSDDGQPLTAGTMACDPSISGKALGHSESFKNGKATLSFAVPKAMKGKQLKVKVTITYEGKSATKIKTYKIR